MLTTLLLALLGNEPTCAVQRSAYPCEDLREVVPICMEPNAELVPCLEAAASLWDVPYATAVLALRTVYHGCTVDSEDETCMELWSACEQPDGQRPICLAPTWAACEDQANVGSPDAAGLVCCAAIDGIDNC